MAAAQLRRPFAVWAMLAGVWALVLAGSAPAPLQDGLCAPGASHAAHHDCVACTACCAVLAALPLGRVDPLQAPPRPLRLDARTDAQGSLAPPLAHAFQARGPPRLA